MCSMLDDLHVNRVFLEGTTPVMNEKPAQQGKFVRVWYFQDRDSLLSPVRNMFEDTLFRGSRNVCLPFLLPKAAGWDSPPLSLSAPIFLALHPHDDPAKIKSASFLGSKFAVHRKCFEGQSHYDILHPKM